MIIIGTLVYLYISVFICVVISLAISATFLARAAGTANATDVRVCEAACVLVEFTVQGVYLLSSAASPRILGHTAMKRYFQIHALALPFALSPLQIGVFANI